MSRGIVESFVDECSRIIAGNNEVFRQGLNKESQTITFTPEIIKDAFDRQVNATTKSGIKYLEIKDIRFSDELSKILDSIDFFGILTKIEQNAKNLYNKTTASGNKLQIKHFQSSFSKNPLELKITVETIYITRDYETISFEAVRSLYRDLIAEEWVEVTTKIQNLGNEIVLIKDQSFFDSKGKVALEHASGSSVSEIRLGRALNDLVTKLTDHINKNRLNEQSVDSNTVLKNLQLQLYARYISTGLKNSTELYIGSYNKNSKQAQAEKAIIYSFKDILSSDIVRQIGVDSLVEMGGSDNRSTIEKKKIVKSFVDNINKDKKVKTKSIDTKLKLSKFTSKKKKFAGVPKQTKRKVANTSAKKIKAKSITLKESAKGSVLNLAALKAQINARLSMQVIKNMGFPSLENRTGRFARSVQVTDVTQTAKGFPSIGYTYQKYPYQTFELGFKQGSTDRDPRTLIDRSIREIATQLIVGRFYTRRV